jgi:hypothetical protein
VGIVLGLDKVVKAGDSLSGFPPFLFLSPALGLLFGLTTCCLLPDSSLTRSLFTLPRLFLCFGFLIRAVILEIARFRRPGIGAIGVIDAFLVRTIVLAQTVAVIVGVGADQRHQKDQGG